MRYSPEFLASVEAMAASYHAALTPDTQAFGYLADRGIDQGAIDRYRLGVVTAEHDEHSKFEGMISIPYITKLAGPVSLKFRVAHACTEFCGHSKYIGPYETRLYNTIAMEDADRLGYVGLLEGEVNALTLDHLCGIPAVGIPGAEAWKAHPEWKELFKGYGKVLCFPDNDEAGERLAAGIGRDIDTLKIVRFPQGSDANKAFTEIGASEIRRIAGVS